MRSNLGGLRERDFDLPIVRASRTLMRIAEVFVQTNFNRTDRLTATTGLPQCNAHHNLNQKPWVGGVEITRRRITRRRL